MMPCAMRLEFRLAANLRIDRTARVARWARTGSSWSKTDEKVSSFSSSYVAGAHHSRRLGAGCDDEGPWRRVASRDVCAGRRQYSRRHDYRGQRPLRVHGTVHLVDRSMGRHHRVRSARPDGRHADRVRELHGEEQRDQFGHRRVLRFPLTVSTSTTASRSGAAGRRKR